MLDIMKQSMGITSNQKQQSLKLVYRGGGWIIVLSFIIIINSIVSNIPKLKFKKKLLKLCIFMLIYLFRY